MDDSTAEKDTQIGEGRGLEQQTIFSRSDDGVGWVKKEHRVRLWVDIV